MTARPPGGTAAGRIETILDFWFGDLRDGLLADERRAALFRADPEFDAAITRRFGADIERALGGKLDHWCTTARGRQALILLLDQFTRNAFRAEARAFAGDSMALEMAREGVGRGEDRVLPVEVRVFFYLPFEHSESLADQDTSLALLEQLQREQPAESRAHQVLDDYLRHARNHHSIIREFGRFPHRNAVLGRPDTPAERAWLARDRRRFGQACKPPPGIGT